MLLKVVSSSPSSAPELKNMTITYYPEMGLFTQALQPSGSPEALEITYHAPTSPSQSHRSSTSASQAPQSPTAPESHPTTSASPRTITIPLTPFASTLSAVDVTLHNSPTKAYDMGAEINAWFSSCFGFETKLVYLGPHLRAVLGNLSPNAGLKTESRAASKGWLSGISSTISSLGVGGSGDGSEGKGEGDREREGITFADVAAYLVITEESLSDVSARLPEDERPMDITKFRPNIVLSGSPGAWDEDFWGGIRISSPSTPITTSNHDDKKGKETTTNIILTQNCARCVSLNVDYSTGKIGTGESGKVLKKLMKDRRVDPGAKWSPIFGRYGFLDGPAAGKTITVGDEVVVTKRNAERTTFGT